MDHRPSIAAVEAGRPGSPVLAAQRAGAVVVAGEAADEPVAATEERATLVSDSVEVSENSKVWRISMSQAARRISFTSWLMLLALMVVFAGCDKTAKPSQTTFSSPDDAGNGLLTAVKDRRHQSSAGNFRP